MSNQNEIRFQLTESSSTSQNHHPQPASASDHHTSSSSPNIRCSTERMDNTTILNLTDISVNIFTNTNSSTSASVTTSSHALLETASIALLAGALIIATILGNILVLIAFKIDKQLQTISNYFLLSLASADFLIGLISMPLSLVYILSRGWPLGPLVCDMWLAIDYLNSNASVLNLLLISFDRYFSVTRPLTYRARRTTRRACVMIAGAWIISAMLWPPWIFAWPAIEGRRTVPIDQCYIPFLDSNVWVSLVTCFLAFWLPVTIMCILYWRIWRETERRYRDLTTLVMIGSSHHTSSSLTHQSSHQSSSSNQPTESCWRKLFGKKQQPIDARNGGTVVSGHLGQHGSGDSPPTSESIYTIVIQLERAGDATVRMIEATPPSPPPIARPRGQALQPKSERKAAKTLSAILLAFIVTWTPYNVLVIVKTLNLYNIDSDGAWWQFAYYLCYINSTLNPLCYALCNVTFRQTYVRILTCKWRTRHK